MQPGGLGERCKLPQQGVGRWQVWPPLTVMMGVSRVLQTSTPELIRGGQVTSERRTVSAVSESPVDAVTTVQRASLSLYCRHLSGRRIIHKKLTIPPPKRLPNCVLWVFFFRSGL